MSDDQYNIVISRYKCSHELRLTYEQLMNVNIAEHSCDIIKYVFIGEIIITENLLYVIKYLKYYFFLLKPY